jgi:quercetin dioxygenase-like cupin family protein
MNDPDLTALANEHLAKARADHHGRSAHLILHDGPLRQSVIALAAGTQLHEHNAPPAASLQVLRGHVRLTTGDGGRELRSGEVRTLPRERNGLLALEDSAVLFTAVTGIGLR